MELHGVVKTSTELRGDAWGCEELNEMHGAVLKCVEMHGNAWSCK